MVGRMNPSAFLLAGGAIVLWGSLALLGSMLSHLPAILTTGIALSIGGLLGLVRVKEWRVPALTLLVGIGGIFGYHVMLFSAFRLSPLVEANLLNYLWPLLIVLLTPVFLPGFALRAHHVAGALMGLAGAALIVSGGSINPDLSSLPGYLLAAAAAVTWASYSLLTKRLPAFGSGAVGAFCLAAGVLSLGVYVLWHGAAGFAIIHPRDWPILVLLGVGPMGTAFFLWDASLKRGDPRIIGSLSYVTPLLSTLALTVVGGRPLSLLAGGAMTLIVAGAAIGATGSGRSTLTDKAQRQ
jgi:drug/metabolite transporter (DMT)-like permease